DILVGLARADDSIVLPHRDPAPLPGLDNVWIGLFDQVAQLGEQFAPPVAQILDSLAYQLRGGFAFRWPGLLHVRRSCRQPSVCPCEDLLHLCKDLLPAM